jgi:hypothetical protein
VHNFDNRARRFQELIEEELLRRGLDPDGIRESNYKVPARKQPLRISEASIIEAEFIEVVPTPKEEKTPNDWLGLLVLVLACTTTGALLGALFVG